VLSPGGRRPPGDPILALSAGRLGSSAPMSQTIRSVTCPPAGSRNAAFVRNQVATRGALLLYLVPRHYYNALIALYIDYINLDKTPLP
jgi:hypothetical protein